MYRKATAADIPAIAAIYKAIHAEEAAGRCRTGWLPDVYPVEETARLALQRDDMYVYVEDGAVLAAGILNHTQVDSYSEGAWAVDAPEDKILVLHTLVVLPTAGKKGLGSGFVKFYEQCAREEGCAALRIDTNAINTRARHMYATLGFHEVGIVPCVFNGIPDVNLVLLEKELE